MVWGGHPLRFLRCAAHRVVLGSPQREEPIGAGPCAENLGGLRLDDQEAAGDPSDHPLGVSLQAQVKASMIVTKW
jgi:hypothetical protein